MVTICRLAFRPSSTIFDCVDFVFSGNLLNGDHLSTGRPVSALKFQIPSTGRVEEASMGTQPHCTGAPRANGTPVDGTNFRNGAG